MSNVPHYSMHGPGEQDFIFIVHGNDDKQLRFAPEQCRTQSVTIPRKVVGIAGCCSVAHMSELGISSGQKTCEFAGNRVVEYQMALGKLYFSFCHGIETTRLRLIGSRSIVPRILVFFEFIIVLLI